METPRETESREEEVLASPPPPLSRTGTAKAACAGVRLATLDIFSSLTGANDPGEGKRNNSDVRRGRSLLRRSEILFFH